MKRKERLLVDEKEFTNVVRMLVNSGPVKRENVKVKNPKNRKQVIAK